MINIYIFYYSWIIYNLFATEKYYNIYIFNINSSIYITENINKRFYLCLKKISNN